MHPRRIVAWASLLPSLILLVERGALLARFGLPWWVLGLDVLFLVPSLLGDALMARGFWLLPETRGRGFLAGGLLAHGVSLFATTIVFALRGDVLLFALPAAYLLLAGIACVLGAAWWDGHERSRLGVAAYLALGGLIGVLGVAFLGASAPPWLVAWQWVGVVLSFAQAWVLLPYMDPPALPGGGDQAVA